MLQTIQNVPDALMDSTADDVLQIHIRRARLFSMLSHGPSFCNPAIYDVFERLG
jgi:hypothetical protein